MRTRIRDIVRQICARLGVMIIDGVLSIDHVYMFVEIPPKVAVSEYMRPHQGLHITQDIAGVPGSP